MIFKFLRDIAPIPTCGILIVVLLSCVLFGIQTRFNFSPRMFSVGASVFQHGHLHRLLMYPFCHQTLAQLLLNITALAVLSGSLEKGFGTVRFLFLFPMLSIVTGLFYSLLDLLQDDGDHHHTGGLLPVALACVALTTMRTKMTKGFLCGVSFPTMALPWVLLIITTVLVPLSVLPCNIIAILVGCMYGKGWFSLIDLSEAKAAVVEKAMLFKLLRRISGITFIPASTEERRKTLLPQINPTPGSYPVQAYAPVSSINRTQATTKFYEGWSNSANAPSGPTVPPLSLNGHVLNSGHCSGENFGHSCNHSHGQL